MKRGIIIILAVALLIIIADGFYVLDETEQVIITQLGKPVGEAITTAGLKFKMPLFQKVNKFEKRILEWDGDAKQIPTSDKRYIWLDSFSRWKIVDPLKFYETTRTQMQAHSRLDDVISGTTRDIISSNQLLEIVRNTNRKLQFTSEYDEKTSLDVIEDSIEMGRSNIANRIYELSKPLIEEYGIELIDVRIKRVNYVQEVRGKVYERMISERNKIAARYRSEGEGNSAEILGKMQRELDQIQSEAYKTAQTIIGEADASAIKIYADAYNRDPEFFGFLKTMEAYEKTLDKRSTLIMTSDSEFYKYLKNID